MNRVSKDAVGTYLVPAAEGGGDGDVACFEAAVHAAVPLGVEILRNAAVGLRRVERGKLQAAHSVAVLESPRQGQIHSGREHAAVRSPGEPGTERPGVRIEGRTIERRARSRHDVDDGEEGARAVQG